MVILRSSSINQGITEEKNVKNPDYRKFPRVSKLVSLNLAHLYTHTHAGTHAHTHTRVHVGTTVSNWNVYILF